LEILPLAFSTIS